MVWLVLLGMACLRTWAAEEERPMTIEQYRFPRRLEYRKSELRYVGDEKKHLKKDCAQGAHHLWVNREHKLVYCAIPKVACSEFMCVVGLLEKNHNPDGHDRRRLFFRMMEKPEGKGHWRGDPHFRPDKPLLTKLPAEDATEIMNDPNFTKFVFFRDPVKRFLSAWVDKFEHGNKYASQSYAIRLYGRRNLTLEEFVDIVAKPPSRKRSELTGLGVHSNPHWRPQRFMCNLEKFLPLYNFVGSFDRLQADTEHLLRATNLWDKYGRSGWISTSRARFPLKGKRKVRQDNPNDIPHTAMFERNIAWHRMRDTDRQKTRLTPAMVAKLKTAYAEDYDMLHAIRFFDSGRPTDGRGWATNTTVRKHHQCLLEPSFDCPPY